MPDKNPADLPLDAPEETAGLEARFPELAEIQREVELRIRDNKRFLERFMDEEFVDEEENPGEDDTGVEEL